MSDAIIEDAAKKAEKLLIHPVVLCELVWVLETAYDYGRGEVATTLDRILRSAQFTILDKENVWSAWADYHSGKGDFADYLIGREQPVRRDAYGDVRQVFEGPQAVSRGVARQLQQWSH